MNHLIGSHPHPRMIALFILLSLTFLTACINAPTSTTLPTTPTVLIRTSLPVPSETPTIHATRNANNTQIAINATVRIAGLTATKGANFVLTATQSPTPAPTSTLFPIATNTLIPVSPDDAFFTEMRTKGYRIVDSGSFEQDDHVYSIYLFREPSANQIGRTEKIVLETWMIAFYRWDGLNNEWMGTFNVSPYTKQTDLPNYPDALQIKNWDNPQMKFTVDEDAPIQYVYELIEVEEDEPDELSEFQNLRGNSSDINHNGQLEFTFVALYCPVSCRNAVFEHHFFEILPDRVIDLANNLPGHLSPYPISEDPLILSVPVKFWYGSSSQIIIPHYFQWDEDHPIEVTSDFISNILEEVDDLIVQLQSRYGQPFASELLETHLVSIPLIYEQLNMRDEGLELFLEISDPSHWPDTDPEYTCWLQFARAQFLSKYETNKPFSVPFSYNYLTTTTAVIERELANYDQTKYDLSACLTLIQDT